jgi:hypothetical protein
VRKVMESESFVSRVMALIQKSRRALRLYSTAGGSSYNRVEGTIGELPSVQVAEWREINGLLLRKLTEAAEAANTKKIIYDVFALRNEFQTLWRTTEAELVQSQRELIASAESGDFIRAATLATNLVSLKARLQAGQAAHHELDLLIKRSKVGRPAAELSEENATVLSTLELLDEQVIKEPVPKPEPLRAAAGGAKVIPLKRR